MWKEIKHAHLSPVIRQHDVGGQKQNWWLVEIKRIDGVGSTAWGFPTKEAAENALSMARGMMRNGMPYFVDYKVMKKVHAIKKPRRSKTR